MKKIALMVLALFLLAACEVSPLATQSGEGAVAGDEGQSLIVYFSRSGNTAAVAQEIQAQTDAAIFEIVPVKPYSDDYDTVVEVAQGEQRVQARPEIRDRVENWDEVETVYIGYPIWWGDMPMILYTFFDSYDFSGKTIRPFCTSGGSGLSNTDRTIAGLEPEATVYSGLHIGDSQLEDAAADVEAWLAAAETVQ